MIICVLKKQQSGSVFEFIIKKENTIGAAAVAF